LLQNIAKRRIFTTLDDYDTRYKIYLFLTGPKRSPEPVTP
jgi:hypothetical protein